MISDQYKKSLESLQTQNSFKGLLVKYDPVKNFIIKYSPNTVLDYGCAKGNLINQLKLDFPNTLVEGYDPGVPEFSNLNSKMYDCLISNDVIEHFEPEFLDQTLIKMNSLFKVSAWLIIACYPAKKHLPDGRNAHLTVESPKWWLKKINKTFSNSKIVFQEVVEFAKGKPELRLILEK